jgi:hypothetical protein
MVIFAEADFVGEATEVAVTVTWEGLGTTAGAVYRPAEVTVPHAAAAHPDPDTVHFTAVFEVPVTAAVNCCCLLWTTVAAVGATVTATLIVVPIVTFALPDCVTSDRDVAMTETAGGFGAVAGAV